MKRERCLFLCFVVILVVCGGVEVAATGRLPPEAPPLIHHYYKQADDTCADVEQIVQKQVKAVFDKDKTVTPKLLKLLYADCMVNGCDASILLDGENTEKKSLKNRGLAAFVLIDKIKKEVESKCPGVVSCTDILVLAVRDAVFLSHGPSYPVSLGRRDGMKSDAAWVDLPSPSISWESALAYFKSKGLDLHDMVTLLGGHAMGRTFCGNIRDRLYNFNNTRKPDPTMEPATLSYLRKQCPKKVKLGQHDPLINLNPQNPTHEFTNGYYSRVLANKSLLGVDQQLLYGEDTRDLTNRYANGLLDFMEGFAYSIINLGELNVLTGTKGEIRRNCRVVNK